MSILLLPVLILLNTFNICFLCILCFTEHGFWFVFCVFSLLLFFLSSFSFLQRHAASLGHNGHAYPPNQYGLHSIPENTTSSSDAVYCNLDEFSPNKRHSLANDYILRNDAHNNRYQTMPNNIHKLRRTTSSLLVGVSYILTYSNDLDVYSNDLEAVISFIN